MSFAKTFDHEEYGQILVYKDTTDEGKPCVNVVFDVPEFGALTKASPAWDDDDGGWENRQKFFDAVDHDMAVSFVRDLRSDLIRSVGG